jgi:3-hydroxymyristoyl/3-hydroxydecanoyl-(acyl carrier protein) dehydratase
MKVGVRSLDSQLIERRDTPDELVLRLRIDADLHWLDGHFPGMPILPGIVQLTWAVEAAGRLRGAEAQPQSIRQLKFKSPVQPGIVVELRVRRRDEMIEFTFQSESGVHSSGRLLYGD